MTETLKKEKSKVLISRRPGKQQPQVEEQHPALRSKIDLLLKQTGFRKRDTLLGLDIGTSGIKLAEVSKTKKGWRLVNAGIVEFDFSLAELAKADISVKLALEIKKALRRFKAPTKKVALSISGNDFIQRPVRVPRMPKKELEQVLAWEIKRYTDLPSDQLCLDYMVNITQDESIEDLDVFLVSVPRRRVEHSISLAQAAGLNCAVLETRATALTGAVLELAPEFCQETFAILDIGSGTSVLNIVGDGFLKFTRQIEWGGENLTLALCNRLGYDHQKAETEKRRVGLSGRARKEGLNSTDEKVDVAKILEEKVYTLIQEVTKSLEYHFAQSPEDEVGELLLTGGGSALPGLQRFLAQQLEMKVQLFHPLDSLSSVENSEARRHLDPTGGRLSVAVGLCTRRK